MWLLDFARTARHASDLKKCHHSTNLNALSTSCSKSASLWRTRLYFLCVRSAKASTSLFLKTNNGAPCHAPVLNCRLAPSCRTCTEPCVLVCKRKLYLLSSLSHMVTQSSPVSITSPVIFCLIACPLRQSTPSFTHTHTHAHANTDTHQIPSLPPTPWTTPAFYPTSLSQIDPGHHKPAACTPRTQPNPCTLPQPTKAAAADPSKTTQTSKPLTLGALPGFRQATHAGPGASQAQRAQNTVRQRARSHVYMQCAIAQTGHNTQCARGHVHTRTHSALAELGHNTLCARGQAGAAPGYMGMMHVQCASTKQSGNVPTPGYGRPGVW